MLAGTPTRTTERFRRAAPFAPAYRLARAHLLFVLALALCAIAPAPADAQTAAQPGFDPRQAERKFERLQSDHRPPQLPLRAPRLGAANPKISSTPLFKLRAVAVDGARAIAPDVLMHAYDSYLGKQVSQADLANIADAISEAYRAQGFHLSRAIVPPQDVNAGHIRIEVIEGAITELVVRGDGAETFGVHAALQPALAEHPSRLTTLQRQLLLLNDRPGLRVLDTELEEIGAATGRFRLIVKV